MRVTVIPGDRWVRRDDEAANLTDWPFADASIHAIQWYGTEGEIEYVGNPKPPNESFTDASRLDAYLAALDEYLAAKAEEEAAAIAAAEAAAALEAEPETE